MAFLRIVGIAAFAGLAAACGTLMPDRSGATQISRGDQLRIRVHQEELLSGVYEVDARGNIAMPLVGPFRVRGLTAADVGKRLNEILRTCFGHKRVSLEIVRPS